MARPKNGRRYRSRGQVQSAESIRQGTLEHLVKVRSEIAQLEARSDRLVRAARGAGATWKQIGDVLGVSLQAAHKRFGGRV